MIILRVNNIVKTELLNLKIIGETRHGIYVHPSTCIKKIYISKSMLKKVNDNLFELEFREVVTYSDFVKKALGFQNVIARSKEYFNNIKMP